MMTATYAWVRPTHDDAAEVNAFLNRCDVAQYGVGESTIKEVLDTWEELYPDRDIWLCRNAAGALVGYATVSPESDRVNCDYYTLPDPAWAGVAMTLLRLATARAAEMQAARDNLRPVAFTVQPSVNAAAREAALACGFQVARHHFRMRLDFDGAPPAPVWPEGITLSNVRPGEDDRALHAFIQQAFARPGRMPYPFEGWQGFMMHSAHFRPDLWFLAEAETASGTELVGAALCYDYPEQGWVRQLAVAEGWRRRGLGSALLRHMFGIFYAAGKPAVGLAVKSENERAYRLYEGVGMRRERQYDEYEVALRPL